MLDIKKIREDFPIFENYRQTHGRELVYLDSMSSSQTPAIVLEAVNEYYLNYRANVHRSSYNLGTEATNAYESARGTIAKFLHAEPWEIIFTPGASIGINMLLLMLERHLSISKEDSIIVSVADHHSNFVPFQELAKRAGATFRVIPIQGTELDYDKAEEMLSPSVKIMTIPLASNVLGTVFDIRRLLQMAKEFNIISIVDATAAIGHLSVDVRSLDCDFLFFSGHKVFGPTGIGVLYGREELLLNLQPSFPAGGTIKYVSHVKTTYRDIPKCFEAGTANVAGAIGLAQAINYLQSIGLDRIRVHTEHLLEVCLNMARNFPGLRVISEENINKNIGIFSFLFEKIPSQHVADVVGEKGICVRAGHHCAMPLMEALGIRDVCRASFSIYNDESDIKSLFSALRQVHGLLA